MGFSDLKEFLSPDLELPVNGKTYSVAPSADLVLRLRDYYFNPDNAAATEDQALTLGAEIFGATYDTKTKIITGGEGSQWAAMEADGVAGEHMLRVMQTALVYFGWSRELAEEFWKSGKIPIPNLSAAPETEQEPAKPNRAARRAAPRKKAGSKAAAAGTTPAPAPSA